MKGDWKTDAFNDGKGNYVLNISVNLNEGRDLYPIQLKSGKIAMYRVSEDGYPILLAYSLLSLKSTPYDSFAFIFNFLVLVLFLYKLGKIFRP